jgi:ABC-type Fe3+/spermidine/putrescine transport system ATPase subunit
VSFNIPLRQDSGQSMKKDPQLIDEQPVLILKEIYKSFDDDQVLAGIGFEILDREILALLGPSGCGKSTLLSIIAGIEPPDQGKIYWHGSQVDNIPPHRRGFGLMFQDYMLFPHMNVYENVAFGLQMSGIDRNVIQSRVLETLELVGLVGFGERDVNSLSGGEQQRVALARSLAPRPGLLMLDEPLASIDRTLRERLMVDLRRILRQLEQTAIYVTHDQEEAFALADRVVVMRQGKVEQIGRPEDIYRKPASIFVARFLGMTNLIKGVGIIDGDQNIIETSLGRFPTSKSIEGPAAVLIRPESAALNSQIGIQLQGKMVEKTFRGNLCQATISIDGSTFVFNFLSNSELPDAGEDIQLSLDPIEGIVVFQPDVDDLSSILN